MASKKTKPAASGDDIDDLFDGFDAKPAPSKAADKKKPTKAAAPLDDDILAELEKDIEKPSRPHTPRVRDAAPAAKGSPARLATPTTDDKPAAPRKSTDSGHSLRASFTPSATSSEVPERPAPAEQQQQQQQGGGWWGSVFSTASAAMKQAEAAVKEIRENEEARKWAEQVRGNVGGLRALGDNLRQQALPTFTNILHTLAPPISQHERLLIHITHDIVGYPSLDPLIYEVFSRVMAQVEGGDLMVIQRGQESTKHTAGGISGWRDGPWWRQSETARDLGLIKGLTEGTKLCRAAADGYAEEYFAAHGGIAEAKIRATESLSETNPVRSSDLFLAIQAITVESDTSLFARAAVAEKEASSSAETAPKAVDEQVCFAILVIDPVHEIEYSAVSQSVPAQWIRWLDASNPLTPASTDEPSSQPASVPDEIQEIIESGGVDPREWAAEWIEETITLSVGVVAQRYVSRRMGVGEGAIGKGKRPADEVVLENAGEAARAGLI